MPRLGRLGAPLAFHGPLGLARTLIVAFLGHVDDAQKFLAVVLCFCAATPTLCCRWWPQLRSVDCFRPLTMALADDGPLGLKHGKLSYFHSSRESCLWTLVGAQRVHDPLRHGHDPLNRFTWCVLSSLYRHTSYDNHWVRVTEDEGHVHCKWFLSESEHCPYALGVLASPISSRWFSWPISCV